MKESNTPSTNADQTIGLLTSAKYDTNCHYNNQLAYILNVMKIFVTK